VSWHVRISAHFRIGLVFLLDFLSIDLPVATVGDLLSALEEKRN
jgi:flagellar biosynthesis protein FliP